MTNNVAVASAAIVYIILVILYAKSGLVYNTSRLVILVVAISLSILPLSNKYGFHNFSRGYLCWFIPFALIYTAVLHKVVYPQDVRIADYFLYRFLLLTVSLFPVLLHSTQEKRRMYFNMLPSFSAVLLFDPIHEYFGVSFQQMGFVDRSYYLVVIVSTISYLGTIGMLFLSKGVSDRYENENMELIKALNATNDALEDIVADRTKKLEQQNAYLEQLVSRLEFRNEEMERFNYTVSHDLKSPLVTVQGFLGFLRKDLTAGKLERAFQDLDRIQNATNGMQKLVNNLLELSRVGRALNEKEPVPFDEIVHKAMAMLGHAIEAHQVQIEMKGNMPTVMVDVNRMQEALQNLIDNAIKYMGGQSQPRITITCQQQDTHFAFCVADNGSGVDAADHDRIFALFERADQQTEGTGLGLALVKRIIALHGGRIWVESEGKNQGASFYFTLPINPSYCANTPAQSTPQAVAVPHN